MVAIDSGINPILEGWTRVIAPSRSPYGKWVGQTVHLLTHRQENGCDGPKA